MKGVGIVFSLLAWRVAYLGIQGMGALANLGRWLRPYLLRISLLGILGGSVLGLTASRWDRQRTVSCAHNMRQIYQALKLYEWDQGSLPEYLADLQPNYLPQGAAVLMCPADDSPREFASWTRATRTNYQLIPVQGYQLTDFDLDFILLIDSQRRTHLGGGNHLLVDGCVVWHEVQSGSWPAKEYLRDWKRKNRPLWQVAPCPHQPGREAIIQKTWGALLPRDEKINKWLAQSIEENKLMDTRPLTHRHGTIKRHPAFWDG